MSSESSYQETSQNTTCHSDSHHHSCRLEPEIQPKSCDLSSPAGSTSSLLSPIYHESYESEDEENEAPNKQTCRISDRVQESTSSIGTDPASNKPTISTPEIRRESRQNNWSRKEDEHRKCNFDCSEDSTSSLLSLIYHGSYESEEKDEAPNKFANRPLSRRAKCTGNRLTDTASKRRTVSTSRLRGSTRKEIISELCFKDISLTAWEQWLIKKTKEERSEMQNKSHQEVILKEANLIEQEKREEKTIRAHEMHKNWVQRKNEKEKLENELKLRKEKKIKEAKEEQRAQAQEKANEKFQEWLNKKKLQEREHKRKEKEDEEKRIAKIQEKKEKANQVFKEWLKKAKSRPRTAPSSFGYANGKLTGYYDGSSNPAPSYCNPIPWKPIPVPCSEDVNRKVTSKKNRISVRLCNPQPPVVIKPRDNLIVGNTWTRARLKKYT
ncbi:coiled-coil domain-containing protein 34 [Callorhinchus milii]|uniref:Coiled-coil domain-containing protein n=1 Tax=Callorhinchus milii TaxID=7868 RepID=A0A4W3JMI3_CALMI|nr:coiled-coil domain-containing protein 34 [Callorhinchus milii]